MAPHEPERLFVTGSMQTPVHKEVDRFE